MKVKLLADSPASVPFEFLQENDIPVMEVSITYEDKVQKELSELDLDWFIDNYKTFKKVPATKQAPTKDALSIFEKAIKDGYEKILYPYMSPQVSDQVNAVMSAAKKVEGKLDVEFYPTDLSGPSQAPFILYAARLLKENKSIEEIVQIFEKHKKSVYTIGLSKDISNLFLSKKIIRNIPISLATSLFRISPIFEILPEKGIIGSLGGLGEEGALRNMIEQLKRNVDPNQTYNLILSHTGELEIAQRLEKEIKSIRDIKEVAFWKIPAAIIVTVGIGAVMVTLYPSLD